MTIRKVFPDHSKPGPVNRSDREQGCHRKDADMFSDMCVDTVAFVMIHGNLTENSKA